ncbi:hypothetical protein GCM10022286_13760 [Gryllotalpicola daejeonensis]|uniref:DUF892 family protein n=1 Tax=Gryllotalpicola daejeonensis TaxID=993087 RepID=A0ABP7ZIX3_9MICO
MKLPVYLELLETSETALAASFRVVGRGHADDADIFHTCSTLAQQCDQHAEALAPVVERYGRAEAAEADRRFEAMAQARSGPLGLLRDLHDVFVLASLVEMTWTLVQQAAKALRDEELLSVVSSALAQTEVQLAWLRTRLKVAAPQTLVAAS